MDTGSMAEEVVARCGATRAALKPIKIAIAPRPQLSDASKVLYAEALASTHLFYAAPTWTPLNRR